MRGANRKLRSLTKIAILRARQRRREGLVGQANVAMKFHKRDIKISRKEICCLEVNSEIKTLLNQQLIDIYHELVEQCKELQTAINKEKNNDEIQYQEIVKEMDLEVDQYWFAEHEIEVVMRLRERRNTNC